MFLDVLVIVQSLMGNELEGDVRNVDLRIKVREYTILEAGLKRQDQTH
jgi:hypothetical protein